MYCGFMRVLDTFGASRKSTRPSEHLHNLNWVSLKILFNHVAMVPRFHQIQILKRSFLPGGISGRSSGSKLRRSFYFSRTSTVRSWSELVYNEVTSLTIVTLRIYLKQTQVRSWSETPSPDETTSRSRWGMATPSSTIGSGEKQWNVLEVMISI